MPRCETCADSSNCEMCIKNAELVGHECFCKNLYSGELCDMFVGECTYLCSVCSGPGIGDCMTCAENAILVDGVCACMVTWTGIHCD